MFRANLTVNVSNPEYQTVVQLLLISKIQHLGHVDGIEIQHEDESLIKGFGRVVNNCTSEVGVSKTFEDNEIVYLHVSHSDNNSLVGCNLNAIPLNGSVVRIQDKYIKVRNALLTVGKTEYMDLISKVGGAGDKYGTMD